MKRKFLTLICFLMIAALTLSACVPEETTDTDPQDNCEHTYSDTWTSNSAQHWHVANCEHTDLKSDLGDHVDSNEDSKCDICSRSIPHVHSFDSEWLFDNEYHWRAATCSHADVKGEYNRHTDANANGTCDICNNEFEVIIENTNEALILQIVNSKGGVSSTNIHSWFESISLGEDGSATLDTTADYKFGQNSMYCKVNTSTSNTDKDGLTISATGSYEKWQEYVTSDTVFGVFTEDGSELALDGGANSDTISGYYFTVSTLADAYGPENLLYLLYQLSQSDAASEFSWSSDSSYIFSFDYLQVNKDVGAGEAPNVNYYKVGVAFRHNKNYVLTDLTIVCECYTNSLADERDNDYTYDEVTGTITMKPEGQYAADTYTIVVTQTAGDRTYVNEHPRNEFFPDSYEVFSDKALTSVAERTINAVTNTKDLYNLYLGNFIPEGSGISFFPELLYATMSDGENVYTSTIVGEITNNFYLSHDAISQSISFKFYQPGTYTLTIYIDTDFKTFTINVAEGSGGNVGETLVEEWSVELGARTSWYPKSENDKLDVVSFTAAQRGNYTFKLTTPDSGAYDKIAYDNTFGTTGEIGAYIDPFPAFGGDYQGGEFTVYLEEGATYEFYVASYTAQTITIQCYFVD